MNNSPKNDEPSVVMQVFEEGESGLSEVKIAPCEDDEKTEGRKRKSNQEGISEPQVLLEKLTTDISESQHNGNIDSSDDELMSESSSEESDENENSENPVATPVTTQESKSNCEATTQESKSNCEATTQETKSNCEAATQENVSKCETVTPQESTNGCEITDKSVTNCEKTTTQESIKTCVTAQDGTSNSETAQENNLSNCDFSPSVKLEEDTPTPKNDISEPQVLLTRTNTVVPESVPIRSSSRWGDRLRVRPPPIPKEDPQIPKKREKEVVEIPKKERPTPRTVAQKKVNYCELSSSEDDEPSAKRRDRNQKSHSRSSDEFSGSEDTYSSDDSRSRRKKIALAKSKYRHASGGSNSSDDDKSWNHTARKKENVAKKETKEKHLSEYEKLRRKNIEEKMAFLQALNFDEIKDDLKKSKKRKKNVELQDENLPAS